MEQKKLTDKERKFLQTWLLRNYAFRDVAEYNAKFMAKYGDKVSRGDVWLCDVFMLSNAEKGVLASLTKKGVIHSEIYDTSDYEGDVKRALYTSNGMTCEELVETIGAELDGSIYRFKERDAEIAEIII